MQGKLLVKSQQEIYRLLLSVSKGKKNGSDIPVKRKEVLEIFNIARKHRTKDRTFRKIFADMVGAGYNVGSKSGMGYFIVKSLKDKKLAIGDTMARGLTLIKKARKMEQTYASKLSKKLFKVKNSYRKIK